MQRILGFFSANSEEVPSSPNKRRHAFPDNGPEKKIQKIGILGINQEIVEMCFSNHFKTLKILERAKTYYRWKVDLTTQSKKLERGKHRTQISADLAELLSEFEPTFLSKNREHKLGQKEIESCLQALEAIKASYNHSNNPLVRITIYTADDDAFGNYWENLEHLMDFYWASTPLSTSPIFADQVYPVSVIETIRKWLDENGEKFPNYSDNDFPETSKEQFLRLVGDGYQPIHFAVHLKLYDLVEELLENDIDIEFSGAFKLACRIRDHKLISPFIKHRNLDDYTDDDQCTPLHLAARYSQHKLIRYLIEKGVNVNAKNRYGNTPLHEACQCGSRTSIRLLTQAGANIFSFNRNKKIPFQLAYQHQKNSVFYHLFKRFGMIKEGLIHQEQENFLVLCNNFPEQLIKHPDNRAGCNPLEIPILFKDRNLFLKIKKMISPSHFARLYSKFKKKYCFESVDEWVEEGIFIRNPSHLEIQAEPEIPPAPKIEIDELLMMFDELNLEDPEQPGYLDPGEHPQEYIREGLELYIDFVKNRTARIGTPRFEKEMEVELFYQEIEELLKHIAKLLQGMDCAVQRGLTLINLGKAGHRCGGRHLAEATLTYQLLTTQDPTQTLSLETKINKELALLRLNLAKSISGDYAHSYNQYMQILSKIINLPITKYLTQFGDPLANSYLNEDNVINEFFTHYTPQKILAHIKETLESLYKNPFHRDLVVDWFSDNIPNNWRRKKFEKIQQQVKGLRKKRKKKSMIRKWLMDTHQIYVSPHTSIVSAINSAKTNDYLWNGVFEMNINGDPLPSFRREAIWHFAVVNNILIEE